MELKQYIQILRRWAWLLLLGLLLGTLGGYVGSLLQKPVYPSATRVLVMRAPQERSSDMTYLSDQQLVQTYLQLLNTQPVRDAASLRLGFEVQEEQIEIQQTRDTQVIEVTVEDRNAARAADIANVLVEVLIEQNESLQTGRYASTEASIQAQIAQVEGQIQNLQTEVDQVSTQSFQNQLIEVEAQIAPLQEEVSALQKEIASLEPAQSPEAKTQVAENQARIDQIEPLLALYQDIYSKLVVLGKPVDSGSSESSRLTQLESTLDLYENLYINLLSSLEAVRLARLQNTPNLVQIEPGRAAEEPIRPRPLRNTALAGAAGLLLAAGIVLLIESLDNTLKTPEDVERALGMPVLGFVAEMEYRNKSAEEVYVARQPRSPVTEAFRSLRTNLEFASVQTPIRTLIVTSPGPGEGKTTVAVNLAAIFAQSGKRVALLDADMRRPCVHRMLGLPNRSGLSTLFRTQEDIHSVARSKVELPQLVIITSGSLPPNPAELLGTDRMGRVLEELCNMVDIIVIDTPPSLVADAQILAGRVDAVLMVVQPGRTQADTARSSLELFNRAGARVIGTVLNRIPRNREYYYGSYAYYSPNNNSKGYYGPPSSRPQKVPVQEVTASPSEQASDYSFLRRVARLSQASDELPPPDPPKN